MSHPIAKVIWPLVCATAFAGGWLAAPRTSQQAQPAPGGGESAVTTNPADPAARGKGGSNSAATAGPEAGGSAAAGKALDAKTMEKAIRDAFHEPNPLKRYRLFADLMDQLTPDNVQAALEGVREAGDGPANFREMALLTYAWGAMDPTKALAYVGETGGPATAFGTASVLSGWASRDPDAAMKWFKEQNTEGWDRNIQARGLIDGMAQANLPAATRLAIAETDPDLQRQFIEVVARQQALAGGIEATRNWVENLAKAGVGSEAVASAANQLAGQWADKDPKAAAAWAAKLSDPEASRTALQTTYREWGQSDPTAASEYLNQIPASPARDGAVQAFAQTVVREDPAAAAAWASTIQDAEAREREMVRVGQLWNMSDPDAAAAWAAKAQLSPEAQQRIQQPPDPRAWGGRGGRRGMMGF